MIVSAGARSVLQASKRHTKTKCDSTFNIFPSLKRRAPGNSVDMAFDRDKREY